MRLHIEGNEFSNGFVLAVSKQVAAVYETKQLFSCLGLREMNPETQAGAFRPADWLAMKNRWRTTPLLSSESSEKEPISLSWSEAAR
jgi:hypothetical protein